MLSYKNVNSFDTIKCCWIETMWFVYLKSKIKLNKCIFDFERLHDVKVMNAWYYIYADNVICASWTKYF